MNCDKCIYAKWIGVDGWGDYCTHPDNKDFKFTYDLKSCNNIVSKNNINNQEEKFYG